jgi:hypothetical protein
VKIMKLFPRKSRKYPILRDEDGLSSRKQAFDLFDRKYRPAKIYKEALVPVPLKTLFRYYEDWKKIGHRLPYSVFKQYTKENPEISEKVVKMLADHYGVSEEEIILRMQKPWGLMQLIKGDFPNIRLEVDRRAIEQRLEAALRILNFGEQVFQNSPAQCNQLLSDIVKLRNNTRLVIEKTMGQVVVRKEDIATKSPYANTSK